MVVLAALAVGLSLPLLGWAALAGRDPAHGKMLQNLTDGIALAAPPLRTAASTPVVDRLTGVATRARLDRLLSRAGRPPAWSVQRLAGAKLALAAGFGIIGLLFLVGSPTLGRFILVAVVVGVAYFTPELLLYSRGQERQQAIQLQLPDTLDQMTIAVEAGLGFEAAMVRAGRNGKGALAQELTRTLQDIQVGQPRREAYLALIERANVPDLNRFLRAVIQADMYGVSIAGVLRTQAKEMRLKRRQRAEEKAMKIPVKVIFPLMFCILPVLFIVLLGPAVMGIVAAFSGVK